MLEFHDSIVNAAEFGYACDCMKRWRYFHLLRDNYYSSNNYNSIRGSDGSVLQHTGDLIISVAVDFHYFSLGTHLHFQLQVIAVCLVLTSN